MYRRPTSPDEFASPRGCLSFFDRSSSAAEFTAPHETTTSEASTRTISPARSTSTACTVRPHGSVNSLFAFAFVHRVTLGRLMAGRTQQTSASLFACTLQTNELHVLQRMHPSSSPTRIRPSGSGDG